jgi:hypothetical protein
VAGGNKFNFAAEGDNLTWSLFYLRDVKRQGEVAKFPFRGKEMGLN